MKLRRWGRRALLVTVLVLALAAAGLPFVEMPSLAPLLQPALEQSLGRRVEFSRVRCALLPVPSLLAENAVIADDPAFGLEPFAYAQEIRVAPRLPALFRGKLEAGAIRLSGASLNVVRDERAGFNVAALLQKAFSPAGMGQKLPEFILTESRINFRSGKWKSAYYLNTVELDLLPPRRPGEELRWQYEASPARTDRSEQGFGRFTGSGRWIPGERGGRFAVDVALERSAVAELLVLLTGRDLGVQGKFMARAFLDGPLDGLELRGNVEILDLERQTLFDFRPANIQIPFQGKLDLDAQTLEMASAPPRKGREAAPLDVRLEGRGLLTAPWWRAVLSFAGVPAGGLLEICRRLGMPSPAGWRIEGAVSGSAEFATGVDARGQLTAPALELRFRGGPPVQAADVALRLEGDLLTLESARITTPLKAEAQAAGSWDWAKNGLSFELATSSMQIAELNGALKTIGVLGSAPLLEHCGAGAWRGRVAFAKEPEPEPGAPAAMWTGQAVLTGARCTPPWLPSSVLLRKAVLDWTGGGWRLRQAAAVTGGKEIQVEARYEPKARPPLQVSVRAERLRGEDLESLFHLAQLRRTLLERTLRRPPAMPPWLRQMDIGGSLEVESLALGRQEFEDFETQFHWRRERIDFHRLSAKWKGAAITGAGEAELWREEPVYRVRAVAAGLAAGGGILDAELEVASSTLGANVAEKARGWAEVSSPLLRLPAGGSLRQLHVSLEYDGAQAAQPWRLPEISFWMDGQFWTGRGEASASGAMQAEFAPGGVQWEGTLWPPSVLRAGR